MEGWSIWDAPSTSVKKKKSTFFSPPVLAVGFRFCFPLIGVHKQLFFQRAPAPARARLFRGLVSQGRLLFRTMLVLNAVLILKSRRALKRLD